MERGFNDISRGHVGHTLNVTTSRDSRGHCKRYIETSNGWIPYRLYLEGMVNEMIAETEEKETNKRDPVVTRWVNQWKLKRKLSKNVRS